jgi:8-oxo-dGTP diphosphatase
MGQAIACAGAIVFDSERRLLLVLRANDPGAGLWSIPGGRCLPDEPSAVACVREAAEETGLIVRVVRSAGSVLRRGPDGSRYAIADYVCDVVGGVLRAGDDAAEARWVSAAEFAQLPLVPGLEITLAGWNALPD